ncbi:MAG: hypothetical protein SGBAC_007755 [Bacillariaceae sp.]
MDETSLPRSKRTGRILAKRSRPGGPVTCVSFNYHGRSKTSILAARGPYLERAKANGETDRLLVFPDGGIIHGVRYASGDHATKKWNAIVYGGKLLAFCDVAHASKNMTRIAIGQNDKTKPHLTLIDWIWDVKIISSSHLNSTTLAIGMARHIVELWKVDANLRVSHQLRIHGQPSCQVTSMDIRFTQGDNLLTVAAGTSFQEIAVWTQELEIQDGAIMSSTNSEEITKTKSHSSLHGHAGVVHDVQFSADGQALASTSDDRSVRYWTRSDKGEKWTLKWVSWGHTARVWSVSFLPSLKMVVSVAEDGTTRLWSCESGEAMECIQHSSSLWKIDTLQDFAVVGATDGTIQCYDLTVRAGEGNRLFDIDSIAVPDDRPKPQLAEKANSLDEEPTAKKPKKPKKKKKKVPTQVIVGMQWSDIQSDCPVLLVATRAGSLMQLRVGTTEWTILEPWWTESVQEAHDIRSMDGCCMALHSDQIAIGTSRGDIVYLPKSGQYKLLSARNLKSVQGLQWIDATTLISFHVASVAVWSILLSSEQVLKPTYVCELEGKGMGVPLSCAYEQNKLVVGDSRGTLWYFNLANAGNSSSTEHQIIQSQSTLQRAHQKEHILDVVFRGDKVCSVGNDGCLHVAYVKKNKLFKGWSVPALSMTGICKLWDQLDSSGFLVSGYYGNTYRMMDMKTGHELFHMDTGGRQRSLHCAIDTAPGSLAASELSQYAVAVCMPQKDGTNSIMVRHLKRNQQQHQLSVPKTVSMGVNMHSETIFDVCLFQIKDSVLVLTGSEDCTSKLSMCDSRSTLIDSTLLTPQESCVKAVCSSQHDGTSAIMVVGGGKLILQFFLVSSLFGSNSRTTCMNDMKIRFLGQFKNRDKATIDHRINAVKALPISAGDDSDDDSSRKHLVVAGDSDGCCHLFIVSEDDESERNVSRGILVVAGDRPILSIDLCQVGSRILVATGNTGGDVLLLDLPSSTTELEHQWDELGESLKPFSSYHAHQMGTNAVNALLSPLSNSSDATDVCICTGGDDQALGMCKLSFSTTDNDKLCLVAEPAPQVTKELSFSAIKGVKQFWHGNERYLLTVGYSQRLALWNCGSFLEESSTNSESSTLLGTASVDLGDVNCLGVLKVKKGKDEPTDDNILVAIGGMGLELMEFSTANL